MTLALHHGFSHDPPPRRWPYPSTRRWPTSSRERPARADLFNLAVPGNIYTRIMNPTNDVLEQRMAALKGIAGLVVSAGSAAITYAIQALTAAGDNIVSTPQLYGGTYTLFAHMLPSFGVEVRFVRDDSAEAIAALIDDKTKAVYCESIGNPAGNIVDLAAFAKVAHARGVPLIVDNTVATPVLCKPIEHGADIVVHSLTKYVGGHGNSLGVIVDSGKFPWADHARFPSSPNPSPPTTGWSIRRPLGRRPSSAGCAQCRCATRARRWPHERLPAAAGTGDPEPAHGSATWTNATPAGGPSPQTSPQGGLGHTPACRATPLPAGGEVHGRPPSAILSFGLKEGYEAGVRFYDAPQDLQAAGQHRGCKSRPATPPPPPIAS